MKHLNILLTGMLCPIWQELTMKSNRSYHVKSMQEATYSKQDIKARDSVCLGISLGSPNSIVQKPDDFPMQGNASECHGFMQVGFRVWVLQVQAGRQSSEAGEDQQNTNDFSGKDASENYFLIRQKQRGSYKQLFWLNFLDTS